MSLLHAALLVASLIVGLAYVGLGLKAKDHLTAEAAESDRSIGWLFWWSLDSKLYDENGKRLCALGNILALLILACYAFWFMLLK